MAFAFVQSKAVGGASPAGSTFVSNNTPGSLLVAAVYWAGASETCTVADDVNGAWTAAGSPQTGTGAVSGYRLQIFYLLSNAATGTAVTVTATVSTPGADTGIAFHEYTGTSVALDGTPAYNTPTGADPVTSGSVTTTAAGAMLFLGAISADSCNGVSPFTEREHSSFANNQTSDLLDAGSAGAKTGQSNPASSSDDNIIGLVAFKEGGAGTDATVDMSGVLAAATAAVVAPPKPRPTAPFSEINIRM